MSDQTYLKTADAAAILGLAPGTLDHQRVRGDGPPFVKFGRSVRYRRCDIDAFMAARIVGGSASGCAA